ncbi:hypothetical protein GCM10025873_21240 [Demequina sediminis]|nr:hypothetical protein GCM10025873_21240 [Demequina sediminis]
MPNDRGDRRSDDEWDEARGLQCDPDHGSTAGSWEASHAARARYSDGIATLISPSRSPHPGRPKPLRPPIRPNRT